MWRHSRKFFMIGACIAIVLLMAVSATSLGKLTIFTTPSERSAKILSQIGPDTNPLGNGTAVVPIGNTDENSNAVVPSSNVTGILLRGMGPPPQNASGSQMAPASASYAHWYNGAQYSGSQYLAQSVSCHLVVPDSYDLSSEFYYVLLSVWDDGTNANSYWANSYDQIGLDTNNSEWDVAWSYSTPDTSLQDGADYHYTINACTLSLATEYVFSMVLSGGQLTYSVAINGGATVWSTSINAGSASTRFIVAPTVYYWAFNYGAGGYVTDFTDYIETYLMDPTIRSPAFNWEFLSTRSDSTYVSTFTSFIISDSGVYVPKWVDTYSGANGYVMIWSGLYKTTDFYDASAYSVGCSVRWEDDTIWLAWRGTSNQNLNTIASTGDMKLWYDKNTLSSQTSPYGPSIIWTHESGGYGYSHLVIAWVGSGNSNYINTMRSVDGLTWTNHWIGSSGSTYPKSDRSPALAFDSNNNILYMAYKDASTHKIVILKSTDDAISWSKIATLSQTTRDAPAIAWAGTQLFYLAFGSDASPGYLNVMRSTDGITWTNQKTLPDRVADDSRLAIGLTCTRDGLSISWYDYATSMVSFRRSAGGDARFWGEKFSIPFGTFYGSATMSGLPKLDRYIAYSSGSSQRLNLLKVCWNTNNPRYGTVDGFVDGFEDSTAFSQNWQFLYGTPHSPSNAQHHRGSYSYSTAADLEAIQHTLLQSSPSEPTGLTGRLEAWIYDSGAYVKVGIGANEASPNSRSCSLAIMSMYSSDYVYRYSDTTYYDTGVARTQGWHCFQIVVDGTNTIGYIDGSVVFTISWLDNVASISIGDWWSDGYIANSVAWDDVSFSTTYV